MGIAPQDVTDRKVKPKAKMTMDNKDDMLNSHPILPLHCTVLSALQTTTWGWGWRTGC